MEFFNFNNNNNSNSNENSNIKINYFKDKNGFINIKELNKQKIKEMN